MRSGRRLLSVRLRSARGGRIWRTRTTARRSSRTGRRGAMLFVETFSAMGIEGDADAASSCAVDALCDQDAFPDTGTALRELGQLRKLAVLSNADDRYLDGTIAHNGWRFTRVMSSEGHGRTSRTLGYSNASWGRSGSSLRRCCTWGILPTTMRTAQSWRVCGRCWCSGIRTRRDGRRRPTAANCSRLTMSWRRLRRFRGCWPDACVCWAW